MLKFGENYLKFSSITIVDYKSLFLNGSRISKNGLEEITKPKPRNCLCLTCNFGMKHILHDAYDC